MNELERHTEAFLKKLKKIGFETAEVKDIAYGKQIVSYFNGRKNIFRIYFSKKKGIKEDFSQIKDKRILSILEVENKLANADKREEKDDFEYFSIGSDEAGKGDIIGPLIVAAVYNDDKLSNTFKILDIKDSKKIKSFKKLEEHYKNIISTAPYHIEIIYPEQYNKLYKKYKNINKILALAHIKAIKSCILKVDKDKKINKIIIDKFSKKEYFQELQDSEYEIVETEKAERFSSVAAASVLARYTHLKYYEDINGKLKKQNIEFSPGVNPKNINNLKKYLLKHKKESLYYLVKLHFKTVNEILKDMLM